MMRFGLGLGMMIVAALIDIRFWFRYAYLIYFTCLVLLGAVEVMGDIGMGAQRWIDFGVVRLQPSEMMKVALILALARYFHGLSKIGRASCRERVCQYVWIAGVAVSLKKK